MPTSSVQRREATAGWIFAAPVILGWIIFVAGPVLVTLVLSLTDYSVGGSPRFLGLENFRKFFTSADQSFFASVRATALYGMLSVPACVAVSFGLALFAEHRRSDCADSSARRCSCPVIIPLAASSVIWMWLFQPDFGVVNFVLRTLGMHGPQWLASERTVIPTMVLMNVWLTGNSMVIFLAALQGVPRHLYEALEIDGGQRLPQAGLHHAPHGLAHHLLRHHHRLHQRAPGVRATGHHDLGRLPRRRPQQLEPPLRALHLPRGLPLLEAGRGFRPRR